MWGLLTMGKGNVCRGSPALLSNKPPSPQEGLGLMELCFPAQPSAGVEALRR